MNGLLPPGHISELIQVDNVRVPPAPANINTGTQGSPVPFCFDNPGRSPAQSFPLIFYL